MPGPAFKILETEWRNRETAKCKATIRLNPRKSIVTELLAILGEKDKSRKIDTELYMVAKRRQGKEARLWLSFAVSGARRNANLNKNAGL